MNERGSRLIDSRARADGTRRYPLVEHTFGNPGRGAERSTVRGEQKVGTVTHYFGKPNVAIVDITAGELRVGDTIRVAGAHSDFTQEVGSMELEHVPVEAAKVGDSVGIQVSERAREHDDVFRVTGD